jgi:hypothetical protein
MTRRGAVDIPGMRQNRFCLVGAKYLIAVGARKRTREP